MILSTLLNLAQRRVSYQAGNGFIIDEIQSSLHFFFHVFAKGKHVLGPFSLLPTNLQSLAISIFMFFSEVSDALFSSAANCSIIQTVDSSIACQLAEVVYFHEKYTSIPKPSSYGNFLLKMIFSVESGNYHEFPIYC